MLLQGKAAVVYGVAGAVGDTAARTFAKEGARGFLAGRTRGTIQPGPSRASNVSNSQGASRHAGTESDRRNVLRGVPAQRPRTDSRLPDRRCRRGSGRAPSPGVQEGVRSGDRERARPWAPRLRMWFASSKRAISWSRPGTSRPRTRAVGCIDSPSMKSSGLLVRSSAGLSRTCFRSTEAPDDGRANSGGLLVSRLESRPHHSSRVLRVSRHRLSLLSWPGIASAIAAGPGAVAA